LVAPRIIGSMTKTREERIQEKIRKLNPKGKVDFSITDSKGKVTRYFSNRNSKVKSGTANAVRELEVEVSSTENENRELLHFLFQNTRKQT